MKKGNLIPVIFAFVFSYTIWSVMFDEYTKNEVFTNSKIDSVYMLSLGVFDNIDKMKKELSKVNNYMYSYNNKKYEAYVCISKNLETIKKVEGIYKSIANNIYVKETTMQNSKDLSKLITLDNVLMSGNDNDVFKACENSIKLYSKE
ncbi:MAG: hypothetical protein ACK5HL_02330 [Bacilli bacterium]